MKLTGKHDRYPFSITHIKLMSAIVDSGARAGAMTRTAACESGVYSPYLLIKQG